MCGQPSHIHGTFRRAFIFKGQRDLALRIEQTSDCMSVSYVCVRVGAYVHIHAPRFQGKSVAATDCQSLAHY